jgi:hypothetical protein
MRAATIAVVFSLAACGQRDRPAPAQAPADEPVDRPIVALAPGLIQPHAIVPNNQEAAATQVVMQWLRRVRYGVATHDAVLELPLVSVVPPCEGNVPCARERIEALMSIEPQLTPHIVASDLISHVYDSRAFDTLGAATHVNVSVFGDLARVGVDYADISFAVMPDASGTLAIVGIEIRSPPKT